MFFFFVNKFDRQPMGFEPMSLWLYTLFILMGGGNAIWVQAHWLQVFNISVTFCFKDLCIYLFEKSCICMLHCFPYHCHFCFFFLGGGLSLWNNLWDIVILQLCFVHLLVPSSNWLALNIICGLLVMELVMREMQENYYLVLFMFAIQLYFYVLGPISLLGY